MLRRSSPSPFRGRPGALYRVAEESLRNVVRHAEASCVEIALQPGVDSVVLRIADSGRDVSETPANLNGHTGLRGMHERARLVGGALAVARSGDGEVPAGGR